MLVWLRANLATILISIVLAVVVFLVIRYLVNERKKGRHICGGDCGSCGACSQQGNCNGNCCSTRQ